MLTRFIPELAASASPGKPRAQRVCFLVNGDAASAMGRRAMAFAAQLDKTFQIQIYYRSRRKIWSAFGFLAALMRQRPDVCYVFDMAYSGVAAALMYKGLTRGRVVIDTGDAITELARSMGRSPLGVAMTRRLEECSLNGADRIVVRGTYHKEWLAQKGIRADVIHDGVDSSHIGSPAANGERQRLGLGGVLTVGLVGSLIWSEASRSCYGWDLVELIRILKTRPVKGVIIGDGSGLPILQARCQEYGIADRVLFLGRVAYEELPLRLGLIDVCLSTQTNDLPGQVRTTGKLPLYLAAGRYILASRVGEAARILDEEMLVDYDGNYDLNYPQKLAEWVRRLLDNPELLGRGLGHVALAREKFDYAVLARKMMEVIDDVVACRYTERPARVTAPPRLAVLCDFPEENWPSMVLFAEMLLHGVPQSAERLCPPFRRRFGRLPGLGRRPAAFNADRLLNRLWDFPRFARRQVNRFDLFHVCDHSYAQLVHVLPAERTGVYCHDLDAFRCLLDPAREPRPRWFRAAARHVLRGLQKAALVFYSTETVRRQIVAHDLIDPARLVYAPCGVAPEFAYSPTQARIEEASPFLLHVGSCIPRKRIDVLLAVFAEARRQSPDLRLIQVGGEWTPPQREQIARLRIGPAIRQMRGLTRGQLAEIYRAAAIVLQPSEAEGFGLPLAEALGCGAVVVASDIPVLREVGGEAAIYCPVGNIDAWAATAGALLAKPESAPALEMRLAQARRYSWSSHVDTLVESYRRRLLNKLP